MAQFRIPRASNFGVMAAVGDAPADRAEEQQDEAEDDHENSRSAVKA
jgi:hypothetical protein